MKLIITRHGQTHWHERDESIWQSWSDIELSKQGREQIKKLALRLKDHNIELIFTSPLKRALETAKEIKKYHPKAELIVEEDLKELNHGILEGLTTKEIKERYGDIYKAREKDILNYKVPGGESYAEAEVRAKRVLDKVLETKKNTVIVAHGAINRLLFKKLMKKPLEEIRKHPLKETSVSTFSIKGSDVFVEEFNCDKHLK